MPTHRRQAEPARLGVAFLTSIGLIRTGLYPRVDFERLFETRTWARVGGPNFHLHRDFRWRWNRRDESCEFTFGCELRFPRTPAASPREGPLARGPCAERRQRRLQPRHPARGGAAATDRGTPLARPRRVDEKLKRRIHEYRRRDHRNAFFAERLLDLVERIERDFEGHERERLLAKARDAFDRHMQLRDQTHSVRDVIARLRDDQMRLLELFELITPRPDGELLH